MRSTSVTAVLVLGQLPFVFQKLVHDGINRLGGFGICGLMCDGFDVRRRRSFENSRI